uniref:protein MIZU-KUSSEI 1-like n=1 Tax=Erigeron canadensis TaxID=72917 RepID=UPI001CB93EC3|nr:protein MIZU-KUSSEI 1-like [Erigeron canadensis]
MTNHRFPSLPRTSSCKSTSAIIPSNYISSTSFIVDHPMNSSTSDDKPFVRKRRHYPPQIGCGPPGLFGFSSFLHSVINIISIPSLLMPTCKWLTIPNHHRLSLKPSPGRKVTGTLFGNRRGHVSFAVQYDPRTQPILIVELAVSTAALVREMSSGLVRIALECEKLHGPNNMKLFHEPMWSMYCNGKKCGYAQTRACNESDWHVLSTVQSISAGAGVIPVVEDGGKLGGKSQGELLYMRARFERVVGSRDSEAFYMMNPDGSGGPELSIFLLRI